MSRSPQSSATGAIFAPGPRAWRALVAIVLAGASLLAWAGLVRSPAPRGPAYARSLPLSARSAISARIGSGDPAYRALVLPGGGVLLRSPAQGLQARFSRRGIELGAGAARISLGVPALDGRALAPALPSAHGNRVSYSRGVLSEWYASGPLGLEQGFTLARGGSSLSLSLPFTAAAPATLSRDRRSIDFGSSLRYSGLLVTDAGGRPLPSRLELSPGRLSIHVDARGARYPLRIDPFFQQGAKLTGAEAAGAGEAGASVALSADGATALIGAPLDNGNVGAAWVFTRSGSSWEQQGPKLTGAGETGSGRFGFRVALSADGGTALIGGPADNAGVGAAWVFTRSGSTWEQQGAKLTGGEESGKGEFGVGVALSGEGATALVGGSADAHALGAAWVFARSGSVWEQQGAKLTGGEESGEARFGFSVALSEEGTTALIGGGADHTAAGAAWVFVSGAGGWEQQGPKLTGAGELGAGHLGFSVALSGDGATALAGGPGDGSEAGAAWVFARSGSTWAQQGAKLTGGGESGRGLFGAGVALSRGGGTALVGGDGDNGGVGAAWVFTRTGTSWEQLAAKLTGTGESGLGLVGSATALSAEGDMALVGGPGDGGSTGAAWVFADIVSAPTAVTGEASAITPSSAVLGASVNPNGQTVSDCHFNYGTSTAYGASVPCSTAPGAGLTAVPVSAALSALSPGTTYHFQIVATNATGTAEGADGSFTTDSPPEFGACVKVSTGATGHYATAGCTLPATPEKHSYEWIAGPPAKSGFTTAIKPLTTALLETTTRKKVTCTGATGRGEYSGRKSLAGVVVTFTGCETSGLKCTGPGAAEGEFTTSPLGGGLGVIQTSTEGPQKNKIGLDLGPAEGALELEASCGPVPIAVRGSVIISLVTNKTVTKSKLTFTQTVGHQHPEGFEGMPANVLEASIAGQPYEQAGLKLVLLQTDEAPVEVSSVV